jgi:hypothetical protein
MSELTEGLDRIYRRFETCVPHRIRDLGQGLSLEVIKSSTHDLPFKLPPEICELYQWYDGLSNWEFLFENYNFLSLKIAIYEYQGELKQAQQDRPEIVDLFRYRFPIFQNWADCGVFLTVLLSEKGDSPIYGYDPPFRDYSLRYNHLIDLILHSAEWYETATFDKLDNQWEIDNELADRLDVKYMARERIIELVRRGSGQKYERYLDESA